MPRTAFRNMACCLALCLCCAACARFSAPAAPKPEQTAQAPLPDLLRAALLLRDGPHLDPQAALSVLDRLDSTTPPLPEAGRSLLLRALALRLLGRYEDAVAAANRLILRQPDPKTGALADALSDAFVQRGLALAALGRHERALEDFDAALVLEPKNAQAHMARGDLFFALEMPDEAEAAYSRAILADPGDPLGLINRGVARDEQGRFAEAIEDFTQALDLDPEAAAAYANRGVSRSQGGDVPGMCADYRAACRLGACRRLKDAGDQGYCLAGPQDPPPVPPPASPPGPR